MKYIRLQYEMLGNHRINVSKIFNIKTFDEHNIKEEFIKKKMFSDDINLYIEVLNKNSFYYIHHDNNNYYYFIKNSENKLIKMEKSLSKKLIKKYKIVLFKEKIKRLRNYEK